MSKDIKPEVLKVLSTTETITGTVELRIVIWVVNGKKYKPKLEYREFYHTESGEMKMGKLKGLDMKELEYIIKNWDQIKKIFDENVVDRIANQIDWLK